MTAPTRFLRARRHRRPHRRLTRLLASHCVPDHYAVDILDYLAVVARRRTSGVRLRTPGSVGSTGLDWGVVSVASCHTVFLVEVLGT